MRLLTHLGWDSLIPWRRIQIFSEGLEFRTRKRSTDYLQYHCRSWLLDSIMIMSSITSLFNDPDWCYTTRDHDKLILAFASLITDGIIHRHLSIKYNWLINGECICDAVSATWPQQNNELLLKTDPMPLMCNICIKIWTPEALFPTNMGRNRHLPDYCIK